jgi:hypothetical protein
MADQKQVIGRGTRTCGQKGLVFHPTMGWVLYVFNYDIEINEKYSNLFNYSKSVFDLYLKTLNIDLRLFNFLSELENTVVLGSVDYKLNNNIHNFSVINSSSSQVDDSLTSYSEAKSIDSLNSNDFRISKSIRDNKGGDGSSKDIPFPKTPLGFKETSIFIDEHFKEFDWTNVKMENLCGYDGPPLNKKKLQLPRNPLSKSLNQSNTEIPYESEKISVSPLTHSTFSENYLTNKSNKSKKTKEESEKESLSPLTQPFSPSSISSTLSENYLTNKSNKSKKNTSNNESKSNKTVKNTNSPPLEELKIYDNPFPKPKVPIKGGVGHIIFGGASSIVNLSPSQLFIKNYFTPQTPQKGLLLNWSVGTGKTCAAIATATSSFESEGYTILWVTRSSLKNDIWKNMFDQVCSEKIRAIIENSQNTNTPIPEEQSKRMKLLSKSWSIRPMSYKQFSNLVSKQNNFYKLLVKKNGTVDPLHKTLIIIDEAHKLYGGNDLSSLERPDMEAFHKALMNSYLVSGENSVRIMLMTATPITVSPMELIKLLNLCKMPNQQIPDNFGEFAERFSLTNEGSFSQEGKSKFLDEIAGYISYLNREKDARQFSQPVIKQVVVPLVPDDETHSLIEKYDFTQDIEHNKIINNLENEIEKQTDTLNDWETVSNVKRFAPLLEKCNDLQKDLKKECIKTVKTHINEIIETSKRESAIIKDQIKTIKKELKEMNIFKRETINKIRKNIKDAGNDYEKFKNTIYNNLKNVCGKKITDFSNLKAVTEEMPEIIEINNLIVETNEHINEVQKDFKNKILAFKKQLELMKKHMKQPELSYVEKNNIRIRIKSEKKRAKNEIKHEKQNVDHIVYQLNKSKKMYEKEKKKIVLDIKRSFKKELKENENNVNKTLKLKRKLEDINIEKETNELKKLITDKKIIIRDEIDHLLVEQEKIDNQHQTDSKNKEELKRKKEVEKEELKRKKEVEKEELKRKKEVEKEELKRKKEVEKEELKRKKETNGQTKKVNNNNNNKTMKNK